MRHFTSITQIGDLKEAFGKARYVKENPFADQALGRNRTLLMIFFNSSLRTRLSTQKAAMNLGMNVIVLDVNQGAWKLETERGVVMDGDKSEHLLEAIPVMGCYCDIIGVRSFARFESKEDDYKEKILEQFIRYSGKPVFSMEAATRHPLQTFADMITIEEYKKKERPKVVMTWAPHPKALPQAVPNSFAEGMNMTDYEFVITHPEGYELAPEFVGKAKVEYDQEKAFEGADFIYAKNWAAYSGDNYGKVLSMDKSWTVDSRKMALTDNAYFMHCLPVRRNMIVTDDVIESPQSIVIPEVPLTSPESMHKFMEMDKIQVFKIGGNVVDDREKLEKFAAGFAAIPGPKVLIHGGGAIASQMQKKLGMEPVMIEGRRVTDSDTLRIVTMVYAGWCNKSIVALLQKNGCNAIGLSGADGAVIKAVKRPPVKLGTSGRTVDYGHVGDITPDGVDSGLIDGFLKAGLTPVFCAITCDTEGNLLNTNADTVASAIAVSLASTASTDLIYCFEKDGVLADRNDDSSLIERITPAYFEELKARGIVADGMLPKLENAFKAINSGVERVVIKNSSNIGNSRQTVLCAE